MKSITDHYVELCNNSPVKQGRTWRNVKTGRDYKVICMVLDERTNKLCVVYQGLVGPVIWVRYEDVFVFKFEEVKRETEPTGAGS